MNKQAYVISVSRVLRDTDNLSKSAANWGQVGATAGGAIAGGLGMYGIGHALGLSKGMRRILTAIGAFGGGYGGNKLYGAFQDRNNRINTLTGDLSEKKKTLAETSKTLSEMTKERDTANAALEVAEDKLTKAQDQDVKNKAKAQATYTAHQNVINNLRNQVKNLQEQHKSDINKWNATETRLNERLTTGKANHEADRVQWGRKIEEASKPATEIQRQLLLDMLTQQIARDGGPTAFDETAKFIQNMTPAQVKDMMDYMIYDKDSAVGKQIAAMYKSNYTNVQEREAIARLDALDAALIKVNAQNAELGIPPMTRRQFVNISTQYKGDKNRQIFQDFQNYGKGSMDDIPE